MSEVGALIVRLQAETAQFRSDMGKVKTDLADLKGSTESLGNSGSKSFSGMSGHAGGLRTQIGLLDNAIRGAHAQAMADLIRKFSDTEVVMKLLPLAATGAAFVVVGGLAVEAVTKIVEKFKEAHDKIANFGLGWAEATSTAIDKTASLDVEVLKLRDETAKLYGKPAVNGPAIAAIEALEKIINLDKGVVTTITDMEKLMKEQSIGIFDSLITGEADTSDITSKLKPKMDAVKIAYTEVLNAESQLQLDTVQKASKAAIDADKSTLAGKKTNAAVAIAAVQTETKAQQDLIDAQIQSATVAKTLHTEYGDITPKITQSREEAEKQHAAQNQILASVKQQATALQLTLGLETQLTQAEKAHGQAEADHSVAEALKKANLEKLRSWEATSKAVAKYAGEVNNAAITEAKRTRMGPSAEDLAAIAKIDPLMASALDTTKREGEELGKLDSYYDQLAEAEKNVANAQEEQNATFKNDDIQRRIEALQEMADEGLISERQLASRLKPLYQQQTNDKIAAIKAELQQIQAIELAAQSSGDAVKADRARADETRLQTQLEQIRQRGIAQQQTLNLKQSQDFQKMASQETAMWNSSITNWIVSGGRFGNAMRNVGAQMLTDAINYAVRETIVKEEQWAIQKVKKLIFGVEGTAQTIAQTKAEAVAAAGLAGANMTATVALAPWPIDMTAPAQGAAAMSAAMGMAAFEQGGKIPGAGAVPILGHGGETVVTKALTDRVEATEGRGAGKGDTHIHNTFAPQIHAFDGEGVDRVLANHSAKFQRHITSVIRRMNK